MFTKNKLLSIVVLLVFAMVLAACSGGGQEAPAPAPPEAETPAEDEVQPEGDAQPDMEFSEELGESVALPEGYPQELFPIYEGSYVVSAMAVEGSYTISAFSKDDLKDVAAFYKDVLKDAAVTSEAETGEGFTSFGTLGDFTYNFDVGESVELEGYKSSITIILMPQ